MENDIILYNNVQMCSIEVITQVNKKDVRSNEFPWAMILMKFLIELFCLWFFYTTNDITLVRHVDITLLLLYTSRRVYYVTYSAWPVNVKKKNQGKNVVLNGVNLTEPPQKQNKRHISNRCSQNWVKTIMDCDQVWRRNRLYRMMS